jgi:putative heme transporter
VQPGHRPTEHRVVRITARSAVVGVLVVVAGIVAQRIFVAAHRPLSWAAAAVVIAVLIDPIVDLLDRHIPRLAAVIVALLVAGGAAFAATYVAFDNLADGLDRLGRAAEDAAERLEERDDSVGDLARDVDVARRVDLFVDTLDERVTGGDEVLVSTAGTAPTYLVGGILTLFLMSYGPRLARSAVNQLPSPRQREAVTDVVTRALNRSRRAVLLMVAEGLVVGLLVTGIAYLLDLPSSAALGFAAGLLAMLPHVGIVLGNLPLILLLLALRSDLAAIVAAVVVIACQLVDSYVVRRRISLYSVHVGLLVPWVVVLVGYAVYGVGGAAFALVFAVFGLAVLDELAVRRGAEEAPAVPATVTDAAVEPPAADRQASESADRPAPAPAPLAAPTPTATPDPASTQAQTDGPNHEAAGSAGERARSQVPPASHEATDSAGERATS